MRQLKKIRLINWHMFYNATIEVDGNILVTGENGTGKSTLLDALQYVLTGGKAKFNIAANEQGKRLLEGYIRGKLGKEGRQYIREGDVTTHIALEFYDDEINDAFVIGAVIDLPENGKPLERFYCLYHETIKDEFYVDDHKKIFAWTQFLRTIKVRVKKQETMDRKKEAAQRFQYVLGMKKKYTALLSKALAFKPIDELNTFIFDFLLNDDRINIDDLRSNIRKYREFENVLEDERKRLGILEVLHGQVEEKTFRTQLLRKQTYLHDLIQYQQIKKNVENLQNDIQRKKHQLDLLERKDVQEENEYKQANDHLNQMQLKLSQNDAYAYKEQLEKELKSLVELHRQTSVRFEQFYRSLNENIQIWDTLHISHDIPKEKELLLEDETLSDRLYDLQIMLDKRNESIEKGYWETKNVLAKEETELQELSTKEHTLSQKRFAYRSSVQGLLDVLRHELQNHFARNVDVRPFCELLDVNDETWRNAIEGYLNTQRFDIIVEPQYFTYALEVYEKYKDEKGLYGVGLVDVAKLEKYQEIKEHTLAEKVSAINMYARSYANLLLGRVTLETDVRKLRNHRCAITPSCMFYNNMTARAISPNVYDVPYIGKAAIHMQLLKIKDAIQNKETEIKKIRRSMDSYTKQKALLAKSRIHELSRDAQPVLQTYKQESMNIHQKQEAYQKIKKDPSWIALEKEAEIIKKQRDERFRHYSTTHAQLENERKSLKDQNTQYASMQTVIVDMEASRVEKEMENVDIIGDVEKMFLALQKQVRYDFVRMIKKNEEAMVKSKDSIGDIQRDIKDQMHLFNQQTSIGFGETIEDVDRYMEVYYRLRDIEIDQTIEKSRIARKKCEETFQEDFISSLKAKFKNARIAIKKLNENLATKPFNGDIYEFIIEPSRNPIFKQYYDIICSGQDYSRDTLWMEELNEKNRHVMNELFERLAMVDRNDTNEKLLQEYTDYRRYMNYDIKICHKNGDYTLFSKVNKEKSGGETQTPYYVVIAASFEQLIAQSRSKSQAGCLVMFDEAFNNMDESRIEAMMQFYKQLNIQMVVAVPPVRIQTITPYVDTTLVLIKQDETIYVQEFENEA